MLALLLCSWQPGTRIGSCMVISVPLSYDFGCSLNIPHSSIYLLPRVPRSPTASLGPRNVHVAFLDSSVISLALLSQYLPSRVSLFNTRRSALRLARCSKVPVIGSLSGSRLDSPSRPLKVPLLAPFLLAAGVSPCAAFFPWPCGGRVGDLGVTKV